VKKVKAEDAEIEEKEINENEDEGSKKKKNKLIKEAKVITQFQKK